MTSDTSTQLSFEEQLFETEVKPYYWVNQSTSLINMTQDLNITERRIIYTLIALVQPDDADFKTYSLHVKDLADLIGYKGHSFYEQTREAINGIMSKQLIIYSNDGKQNIEERIQWVSKARYELGSGRIIVKLSDELAAYLLNLKRYTKYRLINVLKLNSEYSWRIYELLKEEQWKNKSITYNNQNWTSYRVLKVSELRQLLNIPDDTHTRMTNFKAYVLDRAKKELSEKSDIIFDYSVYKKKGRSIDSFIFYINANQNEKVQDINIESTKEDLQSITYLLVRHGVRKEKAKELVSTYHIEYLEANIRYALLRNNNMIENKAGYIIKSIEENFAQFEGPGSKLENDPLEQIILSQVTDQLEARNKKDVHSLLEILDSYTEYLKDNPDVAKEMDTFIANRKEAIIRKLGYIEKVREDENLPPLSETDLDHPTLLEIYSAWKDTLELPY